MLGVEEMVREGGGDHEMWRGRCPSEKGGGFINTGVRGWDSRGVWRAAIRNSWWEKGAWELEKGGSRVGEAAKSLE